MANLNKGKPRMPDIETLISMGLMSENDRESLKPNILTQLRILDEHKNRLLIDGTTKSQTILDPFGISKKPLVYPS